MSNAAKIAKVAYHPFSVVSLALTLLSGGGVSVYKGVPYMKQAIRGLSNRLDVVIYLLCEDEPKCIEEAWEKVITENRALDARHGDH